MPLFASQQEDNGNKTTDKCTTARIANSNPDDHAASQQRLLNDDTMTATRIQGLHAAMTHIAVATGHTQQHLLPWRHGR
jgi:hypothetical protein